MEWLTVGDKARLAHSRAWWTHVPPRYNARQARLVIEESILWPAIIDEHRHLAGNGGTRLFRASYEGALARVEKLIEWGADVSKADRIGRTPLLAASRAGHAGVAQALLAAGAILGATDEDGFGELHLAAYFGHAGCVRVLLEAGADRLAETPGGDTAWDLADLDAASDAAAAAELAGEFAPGESAAATAIRALLRDDDEEV